jgi:hypothetical protein
VCRRWIAGDRVAERGRWTQLLIDLPIAATGRRGVILSRITHDPLLEVPAHALGWSEAVLQILPPTLTIEVSSGWLIVLLIALMIWRDRQRR